MRISLPSTIELTCPACGGKTTVALRALNGRRELSCLFCRHSFTVFAALPGRLRRKVYYALRDGLEQAVYLAYHRQHAGFFDEWSSRVAGDDDKADHAPDTSGEQK